ncbi:hypothetical protein BBK36DRAFT_1126976 [Trichoderma citrinoviride]|uniref:Shikimate kinase n=1 Tax=Trichoderma citrinoviride TaxID=58853 RepID=A0A2T4B297_9HYPO|nr:hypothetical protein BBK36DRAFT_1126976 [Trichoderma citrinoviride]PTB63430.1 hypothetical protein BBK36DRAFT_1126976 [Trichoderma citrinoviride]
MTCPIKILVKTLKTGNATSLAVCHAENEFFVVPLLTSSASDFDAASRILPFQTDLSGKRNRSDAQRAFLDFLNKSSLLQTHGKIHLADEEGHMKTLEGIMSPDEWDMLSVEQPLILAHACCWKFAQHLAQTSERSFSRSHFYRFMRQLHHIIPRKLQTHKEQWRLASFRHYAALCHSNTVFDCISNHADISDHARHKIKEHIESLRDLLCGCAKLPPELQQSIWRSIPTNCLTFSLLATAETVAVVSKVPKAVWSATTPIISHQSLIPKGFVGKGWLHTTFISILGRRYLHRINLSKTRLNDETALPEVDIQNVSHLHFTVEEIGISAIQIVNKDGTESNWLGNPEGGWRGSTLGIQFTDLQVWKDDLKVLSLNPLIENTESSEPAASRALWNTYPKLSAGDELPLARLAQRHIPLMHYPGWGLRQYLPFYENGRHATGMTVYLDDSGTNGVVMHGQSLAHRAGTRRGLSMYMPFNRGERILGLDLLRINRYSSGPFLLIEIEVKSENHSTCQNGTRRCVFFGPATFLYLSNTDVSWLSLLQHQVKGDGNALRGLIVDPLALHGGASFTSIGAHTTPTEKGKRYEAEDNSSTSIQPMLFPDFTPSQESGGIRTIANLFNVKELAVQKTPSRAYKTRHRCIGLFIRYTDGSNAVLGQWDTSASSTIIYDAAKGEPLTTLLFQKDPYVNPYTGSLMVDVVANTSKKAYHAQKLKEEEGRYREPISDGSVFEWLAADKKSVCWNFSATFDHVRYCRLEEFQFQPGKTIQQHVQLIHEVVASTLNTQSTMSETVILIGPEGSGKSTIGRILANDLSKELYSLDRHRDELYAPYGYDKTLAERIYEEQGLWAFYQHWKPFEYKAVTHILQNAKQEGDEFYGKLLDFGAGHSVFEDPQELVHIEALMEPYRNVFLVVPCDDVDEVVRITEERRGHELGLNRHFVEHSSNRRLAKHTVYTKDMTAEECAEKVLRIIGSREEV